MSDEDTGLLIWNGVLGATLKLPGAKVDRAKYLRSALSPHLSSDVIEEAIQTTPAQAGVDANTVKRAAQGSVSWHHAGVTAVSTLAGLPGGWWLAGAIPADLSQYLWHVLVISQKLAYLHGWPDLLEQDGELDDETKMLLTLFIGLMLGAQGAAEGLGKIAAALSAQVAKRLPRQALTKYAAYQVAKGVAKWLGVTLTKEKAGQLVGRAVPVVGGVVAGGVTWFAFGIGATRLRKHLEGLPLAGSSAPSNNGFDPTAIASELTP